jgi:hypothetical protein
LLGFLAKNVRNFEAKIAAVVGLILIALMSFKEALPSFLQIPLDSKMTVAVGTVSIVSIGVLVQKMRKK